MNKQNFVEIMENTAFQWSSFDPRFKTPFDRSEYNSPKEADTRIKTEDGEIAWDLGTPNHPGPPMRKILVGVYASDDGFVAGKWDKKRKDLVGCATVKDWEWDQQVGFDEDEEFTEELVLARLELELEVINEYGKTN